jgi:hypothetical protein
MVAQGRRSNPKVVRETGEPISMAENRRLAL